VDFPRLHPHAVKPDLGKQPSIETCEATSTLHACPLLTLPFVTGIAQPMTRPALPRPKLVQPRLLGPNRTCASLIVGNGTIHSVSRRILLQIYKISAFPITSIPRLFAPRTTPIPQTCHLAPPTIPADTPWRRRACLAFGQRLACRSDTAWPCQQRLKLRAPLPGSRKRDCPFPGRTSSA
jgi:hypothetical protein